MVVCGVVACVVVCSVGGCRVMVEGWEAIKPGGGCFGLIWDWVGIFSILVGSLDKNAKSKNSA